MALVRYSSPTNAGCNRHRQVVPSLALVAESGSVAEAAAYGTPRLSHGCSDVSDTYSCPVLLDVHNCKEWDIEGGGSSSQHLVLLDVDDSGSAADKATAASLRARKVNGAASHSVELIGISAGWWHSCAVVCCVKQLRDAADSSMAGTADEAH